MSSRHHLLLAVLFAATLHVVGVSRSILPAQDGLKFIRIARGFHSRPWVEVVRGSDQHPLYPALIALAQPPVALVLGDSPTSWRIAAQLVSILAYLAILPILHRLTLRLFDSNAVADLCVWIFVLLPVPAELGRDTLGDALGLLALTAAITLAEAALRTGAWRSWVGAGLAAGLGYLARPELMLVPVSVALTTLGLARKSAGRVANVETSAGPTRFPTLAKLGTLGVASLVIVGSYALVKGEISEKLSLRLGVSLGPSARARPVTTVASGKIESPRWDFSPKEEFERSPLRGKPLRVVRRMAQEWMEGLGWIFAPFAVWGLVKSRSADGSWVGRRLLLIHMILFSLVAIRMSTSLGYLSGRHAMTHVLLCMPFAASGLSRWASGFPARRGLSPSTGKWLGAIGLTGLIVLGVNAQVKAMHPSRWGHQQAGLWLREHALSQEPALDTRGWANFVRGGTGYDYWHVHQALSDPKLRYLIVGSDELTAPSRRAETLRALVAAACEPLASFPERQGGEDSAVLLFQFLPQADRKELQP